jgi:alkylhydroperoxidase family enzyme
MRALAHNPAAARAMNTIGRYIRHDSKLDPRLRELAILQVGYLTKSEYEYSHHVKIGFDFGVSEDDVRAIAEETAGRQSGLDAFARIVLQAAREMTQGLAISDATFAALRERLNQAELVDLVLTIGFYNGVVRILDTLKIDVEEEYAKYLEEFPLPK